MSSGAPPSRPARELGLAALFFLAVTVLMTWPQAAHMGDAISDIGDAKLNARILQWDFAQTFRNPLNLYQLNFFHPARYVLAFSENLYGVAVFGFPLLAAGASALVNYNVLLLLGMLLSALAAWALARELTGDPLASVLAGLVFAFLPWRFSQLPHLQFQWAGFLCLSLLFLLRYLERGARRDLVLYGICFAWNALCNVHYALFSGFLVGLTLAFFVLGGAGDGRRRLRGVILATVLGGLVFVPFALPYREASRLYGMRRYLGEVFHFSGQPSDFLSTGMRNRFSGDATARWTRAEGDFFPGVLPVALAVAAVVQLRRGGRSNAPHEARARSGAVRRSARILDALILLLGAAWIWSLAREGLRAGPLKLGDPGRVFVLLTLFVVVRLAVAFPRRARSADLGDFVRSSPLGWKVLLLLALAATGILVALGAYTPYYRFLFQSFGTVFQSIRAPARGIVLFHISLAVLCAWGLSLLVGGRSTRVRAGWTAAAVALLLCEFRTFPLVLTPTPAAAPPVYEWLADFDFPGAVVEWPFGLFYDFDYVFRQSAHGKPILNGYSGFFPATYTGLEAQVKQRPIPDSVWETMGNLGASMLVYHAHDGSGYRVVGYADALDRALSEGRLELVRSFPHGKGLDFVFIAAGTPWRDRIVDAGDDAVGRRRQFDEAVARLRRNVGRLAPPFGEIYLPRAGQKVAPGFWAHGWALDDSGVASIQVGTELGTAGEALIGGQWPNLAARFPDFPDAANRGSWGFPIPDVAPGLHTLVVRLFARDGGSTTLERPIEVVAAPTVSPPRPAGPVP